ncbi:NUDIX domain-containing protein [Labilibaculum sp. DW002]|uniref:NUDIX domain-containing protein n=1 Tax=Paralabilibaculum antarcticum TaxID=2912572 RepID=A0ABT5VNM8_9BACT|nr:NUDIX domain-containing protein [Labilibaculum sp. DW002]MDE5416866.1 NUDIX domain-containing protein [Labilibaculum sp. DW002]
MNLPIVDFLSSLSILEQELTYSIVCSHYQNKWVFVRHRERESWEMPAGHIEDGESALAAAKRELYEETGAIQFSLRCICDYSCVWKGEKKYGRIFFANILQLGKLPQSEIAEIKVFNDLPEKLTYPDIQNLVFEKVSMSLNKAIFTSK